MAKVYKHPFGISRYNIAHYGKLHIEESRDFVQALKVYMAGDQRTLTEGLRQVAQLVTPLTSRSIPF